MQGLSIRLAGVADARALALLGSATMLETYAELVDGQDIVAHCENRHAAGVYQAWLSDPAISIWIAQTTRGAAVGYLVLMPATLPDAAPHPDDLEVQRIYVLSRYHGAGVGHALMTHALQESARRGARALVLGVLKVNARAVAFYERQGFRQFGTRVFQVGSARFDDFVLGKDVKEAVLF